jgi:hypothetical protein
MVRRVALLRTDVSADFFSSSLIIVLRCSEKSVLTRSTRRNIPEYGILQNIAFFKIIFMQLSDSKFVFSKRDVLIYWVTRRDQENYMLSDLVFSKLYVSSGFLLNQSSQGMSLLN